jgi:glycosyltransferase involved in cell wall biosynthesis
VIFNRQRHRTPGRKARVAIVDHRVEPTNPAGSIDLMLIANTAELLDITVFATRYARRPGGPSIRLLRVPAPQRPIVLLFAVFRILASARVRAAELRHGRFDLVVSSESNCARANVSYAHFCHIAYLERSGAELLRTGPRGWARYLDHKLHAVMEPRVWRRCRRVVAVSDSVAQEVVRAGCTAPVSVIENPVALDDLPERSLHPRPDGRTALVFVALGSWHRKGLDLILGAFEQPSIAEHFVLEVLGGEPDLIRSYEKRVPPRATVTFRGFVDDVEKRLSVSGGMIAAPEYEPFGLGLVKAAAIGVPVVTTRLGGFANYFDDSCALFIDDRSVDGVTRALERLHHADQATLDAMVANARERTRRFDVASFGAAWRTLIAELLDARA